MKPRYINLILIILGGGIAIYAEAGEQQNVYILISGLLVLMIGLILNVDEFRDNWDLYFITFGMVVGSVIYPVWLFQGMEKMKYISILNIIAKSIF
mgnify:CR=1 FL=1